MLTFADFDTQTEGNKRYTRQVISAREYAEICLNCTLNECLHDKRQDCYIINQYRTQEIKANGEND